MARMIKIAIKATLPGFAILTRMTKTARKSNWHKKD